MIKVAMSDLSSIAYMRNERLTRLQNLPRAHKHATPSFR